MYTTRRCDTNAGPARLALGIAGARMAAVGLSANLIRCLAVLLASLLLVACGGRMQEQLLEEFSRSEDRARAQAYIDQLRSHDFAALEQAADSSMSSPYLHDYLAYQAGLLPSQSPQRITLVGMYRQGWFPADTTTPPVTRVSTGFEYDYGGQWRLIQVSFKTVGNRPTTLTELQVEVLPQPLKELNRFTLAGKGVSQYAMLTGIVVFWLLILAALILCIRTRMPRRKWLWLLFILVGLGRVSVNWTTGAWDANLLIIQLLGTSAGAAPFGPWIVSCSVPLGALVFLFYKWPRLRRTRAAA